MAYIVNNKQIKQVSVLTEPNSYQTDIKPEDMQSGSTCVSKGKVVTGTGRAFEFAKYGQSFMYPVLDVDGNTKIGIRIPEPAKSNVLFVSSTSSGDIFSQDVYLINLDDDVIMRIGDNHTTKVGVFVQHIDKFLCIYVDELSDANTVLNYFEGKDNQI